MHLSKAKNSSAFFPGNFRRKEIGKNATTFAVKAQLQNKPQSLQFDKLLRLVDALVCPYGAVCQYEQLFCHSMFIST